MQLTFLPYTDGIFNDNWRNPKRDLSLLDILPSVWLCNEGLVFDGSRRIDGMKYEILDEGGASVQDGALTVIPGMKQTVSLTCLLSGKSIKPIALKKASVLSNEEMKSLFGGSGGEDHYCKCVLLIDMGPGPYYRQVAPVIMAHPSEESCASGCQDNCSEYVDESGHKCVNIDYKFV